MWQGIRPEKFFGVVRCYTITGNEMKNIVIIVACFAVLVVISDGDDRHHRVKRKVLFTKNSKLFVSNLLDNMC